MSNLCAEFIINLLLVCIIITTNICKTECSLVINKCCGAGMIFDKGLKCVRIPEGNPVEEFHWFPVDSIVDVTTFKVHKSRREFYSKLLGNATIKLGKKPECKAGELDSTTFAEDKPLFNFLLYGDSEMRVHVSSNKTLHRFEDALRFPVAEGDEMEEGENSGDGDEDRKGTDEVKLRTFPLASVCVDAVLNTGRHRILICPCLSSVCIRKCCKDEEYYNVTAQRCLSMRSASIVGQKWRPKHFEARTIQFHRRFSFADGIAAFDPGEREHEEGGSQSEDRNLRSSMWAIRILGFWLTAQVLAGESFHVNKCCPKNQKFDEYLNCVPEEDAGYDEEETITITDKRDESYSWFPFGSIVNSTTLKIHEHRLDYYVELLSHNITINYGRQPNCSSDQTKQISYFKTDVIEFYHFILFENLTMRFHISKPGSLHDPAKDAIHFATISKGHVEEDDISEITTDSLRTFPMEDACVETGFADIHFLVYCPCRAMVCVRKCCSDGEYYNATSDECEPDKNASLKIGNWRPRTNGVIDRYYLLSDTFPSCENPLLLKVSDHAYKACNRFNKETDNDFTIFDNGSIKVNKYKKPYETNQYCGEVTWHEDGKIYDQNLILCSALKQNEQDDDSKPIKSLIYGTLLIIGGICLFITVAVSLYLPELRRRMHNKIALSHNSSLMVAYFTWAVGQLSPNPGGRSCMLIALIIQFTFLGSFFWLNVMCIDISMTFSATRSLGGHSSLGEYKKFVYYCIYSWGTTTVISVITLIMEFLPDVPYDFLKPGFACSCGFNTANASILIYFYGPMSILLIFNLILFIFTTIKIMSVQRQTAILHKTDSNTTGGSSYQSDKQRYDLIQWLILYAKLFLLMGLTWITEIISWAVGGPDYYWYFSDILNLLRAVFIFILFICKRPVWESLRRKLRRGSSMSTREGYGSKSMSDVLSTSSSMRDSRQRSSTNSSKRKESNKGEAESQKLILGKQAAGVLSNNGGLEESCM